jgi:hypothetical protein
MTYRMFDEILQPGCTLEGIGVVGAFPGKGDGAGDVTKT